MMAVQTPEGLGYGRITGRLVATTDDGPDEDTDPDTTAISGTLTATPSVEWLNVSGHAVVLPSPVTGSLDDQGYIIDAQGNPGLSLIATDLEGVSPKSWTWQIHIKTDTGHEVLFPINVPEGSERSLSDIYPVAISKGVAVTRGPKGRDGLNGLDGVGIPLGGKPGQRLVKSTDADYDTAWEDEVYTDYAWTGEPHKSTSMFWRDGEHYATNLVTNPRGRDTDGTVVVAENLIVNPSFEHGTAGWTIHSSMEIKTAADSATDVEGERVGALSPAEGQTPINNSPLLRSEYFAVSAGEAISVRVRCARSTAQVPAQMRVLILWYGDSGFITSSQVGVINTAAGSPRSLNEVVAENVKAPDGATRAYLGWYTLSGADTSGWVNGSLLVDAHQVVRGSSLPDYFDGDTSPDSDFTPSWTGTPGASTSQLTAPKPVGWAVNSPGSVATAYYSAAQDAVALYNPTTSWAIAGTNDPHDAGATGTLVIEAKAKGVSIVAAPRTVGSVVDSNNGPEQTLTDAAWSTLRRGYEATGGNAGLYLLTPAGAEGAVVYLRLADIDGTDTYTGGFFDGDFVSRGGGLIRSVNGHVGHVVISAADVGAMPEGTELFDGQYSSLEGKPVIPVQPQDIGAQPAGNYLTQADMSGFATAAQGAKADSAVQPAALEPYAKKNTLSEVATSGLYADLEDVPDIPSAPEDIGAQPAGSYASAAQGAKADSAVQPAGLTAAMDSLADVATSGAYSDLSGLPTIPSTPGEVGAAPTQHNHPAGDVNSGTFAVARIPALPITKVTGLQSALDAKVASVIAGDGIAVDSTDAAAPVISMTGENLVTTIGGDITRIYTSEVSPPGGPQPGDLVLTTTEEPLGPAGESGLRTWIDASQTGARNLSTMLPDLSGNPDGQDFEIRDGAAEMSASVGQINGLPAFLFHPDSGKQTRYWTAWTREGWRTLSGVVRIDGKPSSDASIIITGGDLGLDLGVHPNGNLFLIAESKTVYDGPIAWAGDQAYINFLIALDNNARLFLSGEQVGSTVSIPLSTGTRGSLNFSRTVAGGRFYGAVGEYAENEGPALIGAAAARLAEYYTRKWRV